MVEKEGAVRDLRWLAWTLAVVAVLLATIRPGYTFASWHAPLPPQAFGSRGFAGLLAYEFAAAGLILATKRPDNGIGLLFLAGAVVPGSSRPPTGRRSGPSRRTGRRPRSHGSPPWERTGS